MDGPSGGGGDNRGGGGGWQGRKYDATNQIKQFLGVPTEDDEKPIVDAEQRTPPQNIPRHRQGQIMNEHLDRSGSPSTRHQRMDNQRYHDGRHRGDSFESPGRNHPRHHDMNRTPPHRYQDIRHRQDSYGSPNRGNFRLGNDRGYSSSPRNHYNTRDMKDHKEMRINGPRHVNASAGGPGGMMADVEAPDFRPSPEVLAELEEQFLYPLKKKSLKFPKAKYFCRLCDYHCDSLVVCRRHIMDSRHRKLKEAKDVDTTLKNMPTPSEAHLGVIDNLIKSIAEEMQVTPDMMEQRREVVAQLNSLLVSKVEGCHLEMVGSSLSGFCLKTSDINIDVVMDDNLNPSTALLAVRELVGRNGVGLYKDVVDDLSSSFPTMAFTHVKTSLRMVVGACSPSSRLTNQLLADYATLDPRVKVLGIVFRYWAQLCQIDSQARGTLPPHVFPLMVVHFLQQHQAPVLPVLHMLHPNKDGDSYLSPTEARDVWQPGSNTQSIGRLWLEMFRFYTVGFKATELVINVRQLQPMTRAEKTWSKKIAVEDPFLQKRNLTRTVSGNPVFEYIMDRFKTTYRYFAVPQLSFGPLFHHIVVKETRSSGGSTATAGFAQKNKKGDVLLESIEKVGQSQSEGSSECEMEKTDDDMDITVEGEEFDDEDDPGNFSSCEPDLSSLAIEDNAVEETGVSPSTNGVSSPEEEEQFHIEKLTSTISLVTPSQAAKLMVQIQEDHIILKFEGKILKNGIDPPLICGSCQKEGHCKADCREDELPPLKPLPPMKSYFINQLTAIFEKLTKEFEPTFEEIEERDRIVADLEFYIRQFFRGVTLKLFGSSANGFGFQRSDLDICLTFEGNPTGQDIDHIKVIESLAEKLKKYRQCGHVFAITTAKVPIVKFSIRRAALEGDLSLYNTLALQNTKLLSTYAKIDYRVKCLGYGMKYFAKLCDIGDASRGSLSSYAYILMVLHFLQQCKPPVIPVLQELYDHSKPAPQLIIDGWNAWFYDDLKSLPQVWKEFGKNKESVGQLWVSMLRYYTETFNWKENVVTIRQYAPLTRLQKLWNSRCIVIEDPFDLSHNLGAGLSRKMNTFIMKAFIRGREVFGSPIQMNPQGYKHLVDYLFDTRHLTDGAPPNDRGCRFCGKIGHIQKDCPKKKLNMERREKKERQKDRQEQRSAAEAKREDMSKHDLKHVDDNRLSDKTGAGSGSKGNTSAASKRSEGIAMFRIPRRLMLSHIDKWDNSMHYQKYGYKVLGIVRYLPTEAANVLNKSNMVMLHTPNIDDYKWAVNTETADSSVKNFMHLAVPHYYKLYKALLKEHAKFVLEADLVENDQLLPEDIGEALHEKMREITTVRKHQKAEKKRLRYRKRAERAEREKKGSEFLSEKTTNPDNDSAGQFSRCGDSKGKTVNRRKVRHSANDNRQLEDLDRYDSDSPADVEDEGYFAHQSTSKHKKYVNKPKENKKTAHALFKSGLPGNGSPKPHHQQSHGTHLQLHSSRHFDENKEGYPEMSSTNVPKSLENSQNLFSKKKLTLKKQNQLPRKPRTSEISLLVASPNFTDVPEGTGSEGAVGGAVGMKGKKKIRKRVREKKVKDDIEVGKLDRDE